MQLKEITLANLETSTEQEVFDWVVWNLLKQGKPSVSAYGICKYRGKDGLKCAAGWCIADSEYKEEWENERWRMRANLKCVPRKHARLIQSLQECHDDAADAGGIL